MKISSMTKVILLAAIILIPSIGNVAGSDEDRSFASRYLLGPGKTVVETMPPGALIAAAGATGASPHRRLVRPGQTTTFMVRLLNRNTSPLAVQLELSPAPAGWTSRLELNRLSVPPGKKVYVRVELTPAADRPAGETATVTVKANRGTGQSDEIALTAEVATKPRIYFISIDSLDPAYLELNAQGNGRGKEGDWLMPNLHAFLGESTSFPKNKVHLISATDMNHSSYLNGSFPGRTGIYMVNIFMFGFDAKGNPILKTTPVDLMHWGADGRPVTTIFNVVKDPNRGGNPNALTAYVSGKNWVPQHYRNPAFGLDRIATVNDFPDYVAPLTHREPPLAVVTSTLSIQLGKARNEDAYLWEDIYAVDQAIDVVNHEDPDVLYLLLGGIDASGHMFGSAWDLAEWDDRGTPEELGDDISRYNRHANRRAQIKTVKNADQQLGRFVDFLKRRDEYENSYIVVESDHSMVTVTFEGPKIAKILKTTGYSSHKDYFFFTASQEGVLFVRPGRDRAMLPKIEAALEASRMSDPVTGEVECPIVVINREEMKTGIDLATGERITAPLELYSEYYIEHPKPGEQVWPDLIIMAKKHYQLPLMGIGLASVGLGDLDLSLPPINVHVGGHGGAETQAGLLSLRGPGIPRAVVSPAPACPADVAPTLYELIGYPIPENVQGKRLSW